MIMFNKGYYTDKELENAGFKSLGKNIKISKNCTIIGIEKISIGSNVRIDDYTTLVTDREDIIIGDYVHICQHCHISGGGGIEMKGFNSISAGASLYSSGQEINEGKFFGGNVIGEYAAAHTYKKIVLEENTSVGTNAVVLPGVTIHKGAAIGALSLVTKSLEPWGIYIGIPAKKIKDRTVIDATGEWERKLKNENSFGLW